MLLASNRKRIISVAVFFSRLGLLSSQNDAIRYEEEDTIESNKVGIDSLVHVVDVCTQRQ